MSAGSIPPVSPAASTPRLTYADMDEIETTGAGALLDEVEAGCSAINQAVHDTFVSYPLELRLPA